MKKTLNLILFIVLFWIGLFQNGAFAYDDIIYIWQRSWDEQINDSIKTVSNQTESFAVLCGDLRFQGNESSISIIDINWRYLKEENITLAFRINTEAGKLLKKSSINTTVDAVSTAIKQIINDAPPGQIVGVQFDYDCPTSKLGTYENFIKLFRKKMPEMQVSITSLPTWLNSRDFKPLIDQTDYYVLQLHSFELPKTIEQARKIFPKDRAKTYIKKASSLKCPYYISLPTYGYEVAFDGEGKFIGLRAEGADILWGRDIQYEAEVASVGEVADFLDYIKENDPHFLKGICWFRLPVKKDQFNWDIRTLAAVLQGKKPLRSFDVELLKKQDGLVEIYLANTGEQNFWGDIGFNIVWSDEKKPLYDVLGNYKDELSYKNKTIYFRGPAPKVGEKILVSWLRVNKDNDIKSSEVAYENN